MAGTPRSAVWMAEFLTFEGDAEKIEPADRLYRFLQRKKPEHVEIADELVRKFIKHLEAEGLESD